MYNESICFPEIVQDRYTAVVAIIVHEGNVLLLKRNNPPLNWCPPCGRAEIGEKLEEALRREVKEETGLFIKNPIKSLRWEGIHDGEKICSFTFICYSSSDEVILSEEHNDFCWVKISDLKKWKNKTDFSIVKWPSLIKIYETKCKKNI